MCQPVLSKEKKVTTRNAITSLVTNRSPYLDLVCFLAPALFFAMTNVIPIYLTGILRFLSTHLTMSLHYSFVDKDNYHIKLSQKQLQREKGEYLVGIILHMWAQVVLQLLFPGMYLCL